MVTVVAAIACDKKLAVSTTATDAAAKCFFIIRIWENGIEN
jgi:hypothetical protein